MLELEIPARDFFDDATATFFTIPKTKIQLEHSLVSLSKWESMWCKPFLSKDEKTDDQVIDYIRCMTITQNIRDDIFLHLPSDVSDKITRYINAPMTATWFSKAPKTKSQKIITSEVIYYWMIVQNIPMECQKWHLNRLLTLIRVCNEENAPKKKRSRKEALSQRAALNAARKQQYGTKG